MNKAPWKDYNGGDIHEGDTMIDASGRVGKVLFMVQPNNIIDQWQVKHGCSSLSRLVVQISHIGRAVVVKEESNDE